MAKAKKVDSRIRPNSPGSVMRRLLAKYPRGHQFTVRALYCDFRRVAVGEHARSNVVRRAHELVRRGLKDGKLKEVGKVSTGPVGTKTVYEKL